MFKILHECAENADWEENTGEVKGSRRGHGWEWGSIGVEERVINHIWVTHNEI